MVKNVPAMQDCRFDFRVGKIPWSGMATHSSTPAWRIPWTEEPGRLGVAESDTTEQ